MISATLPAGADQDRASSVAHRFGRIWTPITNAHVTSQLLPGEEHFLTPGHCDCGTLLGQDRRRRNKEGPLDKYVVKLRKKGWGESKIERWLAEKSRTTDRRAHEAERRRSEDGSDTHRWSLMIRALHDELQVDHVGLLLHWYRGPVDDERIDLVRTESIAVGALDECLLGGHRGGRPLPLRRGQGRLIATEDRRRMTVTLQAIAVPKPRELLASQAEPWWTAAD